ncbi:MAG: hypothetical protein AAGJ32_05670 [Pseudomonadota bacterium]
MNFELPMPDTGTALIDVRRDATGLTGALSASAEKARNHGAVGAAVYRSLDDDKVLSYAQWSDPDAATDWLQAHRAELERIGRSDRWTGRLFRLASSANKGPLALDGPDAEIAHTGLFEMRDASRIAAMLALAKEAAETAVTRTPALLTANFHVSLDNERVVNLGFWSEEAAFRALAANPPFQNKYWIDFADNEPGFYRRVFVA